MPWARRFASWIAVCLLALAACGGDDRVVKTDGGEVQVSREGEEVTIRSEERGIEGRFGPGAALPADFPDDVPLPAGAEVVGAMTSRDEGAMVSLRSDAPAEALQDALREAIAAKGWSLEEDTQVMMGQHLLTASKGARSLTVQTMATDEGTRIMVHVSEDAG